MKCSITFSNFSEDEQTALLEAKMVHDWLRKCDSFGVAALVQETGAHAITLTVSANEDE